MSAHGVRVRGRDKFRLFQFSPQLYFLRCIVETNYTPSSKRNLIKIPNTSTLEFSMFLNKHVNRCDIAQFIDVNSNETCLIPLFKTKEECEKYIKKHFKNNTKIYNTNYIDFSKEQRK